MTLHYLVLTTVGCIACVPSPRQVERPNIDFGPLPCDTPRAGPARLLTAAEPDPALPPGRGALVLRFVATPGDSVLRGPGSPRLLGAGAPRWLRRDSTHGVWVADSVAGGRYTVEPRFNGWATETVAVVIRPGYADTAVFPLEQSMPCLWAIREDAPPPAGVGGP